MKDKVCPDYCGVACVDGTCPQIDNDRYSCGDCWLYEGCKDCAFNGEDCPREKRKAVSDINAMLTSIQPPHTNRIFNLIKGIEWRTKPMPTGTHYCYETKNGGGCGKVIGKFKIWRVKRYENVSHIPNDYITLGCVSREHLTHYSGYSKHKPLYAHFIVKPIRYDNPKELGEFTGLRKTKFGYEPIKITRPPQSWCYVEELKGE